jgi:hypothetical protein
MNEGTLARIIQTFCKFLSLYDEKMRAAASSKIDLNPVLTIIQNELTPFTKFLDHPDMNLRC